MEKQSRLFGVLVVVIGLLFAIVIFQPVVEEQLAPELVTAWVAIESGDSGVAEVGPVSLESGAPFKLHAVLEARSRNDRPIYYTPVARLSFGGREVPAESLKRWDRPQPIKVRWFTVEGRRPYFTLTAEGGIKQFEFQEFLRSDWPLSWSVPGEIDSANDSHLEDTSAEAIRRFGTQRYHVRIELYQSEDSLIPERVIRSWGISDLKAEIDRFPTMRMTLSGAPGPASRVFGLTQLEPPAGADRELLDAIGELAANDIAFSKLTVLGDQIRRAGAQLGDLGWTQVDLAGEARWGDDVGPGDIVRVGDRVVVLYEDRGTPDVLDYEDLCFDYVQGAAIRALNDVFIDSGNTVEIASLRGTPATP